MKKADECRQPLPVLVLRGRTAGSSTEVGASHIVKSKQPLPRLVLLGFLRRLFIEIPQHLGLIHELGREET